MSEAEDRCRCECRCGRRGLGPSMVCTTCWFHECPPRRAEMDRVWEENEAEKSVSRPTVTPGVVVASALVSLALLALCVAAGSVLGVVAASVALLAKAMLLGNAVLRETS